MARRAVHRKAQVVDQKLAKYRSMRDFRKTAEPSGTKAPRRAAKSFVIQQHADDNPRKMVFRNARLANEANKTITKKNAERSALNNDVAALVKQLPLGFELTNLDKVLYPEQGITKAQLVAYLAVVADWMLPQLADRPLTLVRCPEGRHKPCFFQKKLFPGSPTPILTVDIEAEDGDVVEYMRVKDMPGLVGLAQLGTLEIHTWGCHAARANATVAVPITWEELAHGVDPASFTTQTVPQRLAGLKQDPWTGIDDVHQAITAAAWRAVGGRPR